MQEKIYYYICFRNEKVYFFTEDAELLYSYHAPSFPDSLITFAQCLRVNLVEWTEQDEDEFGLMEFMIYNQDKR